MQIVAVNRRKAGLYQVVIEGGEQILLDGDVLFRYQIQAGKELDAATLQEALHDSCFKRAKERALHLLTYRDHSRAELCEKLLRDYPEPIVEEIAQRMEELGFIDDSQYAHKLANRFLVQKRYSFRRAEYEMRRKGLCADLVHEALCACDVCAVDQIYSLIEKKYASKLLGENGERKVASALARLGFSYSDIRTAIQSYMDEELETDYHA